LPFQAHPRVASRPKSPAPIVATLFGLPATLRAGTESVLFPWRCSRRGRTLWVMRTAPQNATRPLEGENPTPVFPSVRASNFRCPCRSTPGPAILSFKRGHSPLSPTAVTKVAETTFAPAPKTRFALSLSRLRSGNRHARKPVMPVAGRSATKDNRASRTLLSRPKGSGGLENKVLLFLDMTRRNRPSRMRYNARSRSGAGADMAEIGELHFS
jgi:hypothetical protein